MQFISFYSLIILAATTHLVGAYNPIGQPCGPPRVLKQMYWLHTLADFVPSGR
jgi:hypothetical protein